MLPSGNGGLIWAYIGNGEFEKAEKLQLQLVEDYAGYDNLSQLFGYANLIMLFFYRGEFEEVEKQLETYFQISKHWDYTWGIYHNWTFKAFVLEELGQYVKALEAHTKSLELRILTKQPYTIFLGHRAIFYLYYDTFKATKDQKYLVESQLKSDLLKKLATENPEHSSMTLLSQFSEALLLKFGNIRAKAKAMDIFEGLLKKDLNNIFYILELLDSLFEDVSISMDTQSLQQIENLISQLNKINFGSNPEAIFRFISQQMVLADYSYYIEGDPSAALQILEESKKHLIGRKLDNLSKIIISKIDKLSGELGKWENIDLSIKDRIANSKISDYLQDAIRLTKKSM